ncbi:hypothetical protein OFC38_29925, partial [Escherichia coli]|nr:hypothetical protein [Escherichia coli]
DHLRKLALLLVEALEKAQGMEAYWKTQCRGITDHCEELQARIAELESRTVPSSMTPRESVIWFDLHEDEQSLKNKVAEHPHSKFLVCNEDIDHIIGYVDSKDLLNRV